MIERRIIDENALSALTDKQREVLDLVLDHKTSKEIARRLGISPHTVDQRIHFAKLKLDASSRSELALQYRRLLLVCEPSTYEESRIASSAFPLNDDGTNEAERLLTLAHPKRIDPDEDEAAHVDYRVVPEMFEGRHGTLVRLGAIVVFALLLIFLALGGLAMFGQLSQMFAS